MNEWMKTKQILNRKINKQHTYTIYPYIYIQQKCYAIEEATGCLLHPVFPLRLCWGRVQRAASVGCWLFFFLPKLRQTFERWILRPGMLARLTSEIFRIKAMQLLCKFIRHYQGDFICELCKGNGWPWVGKGPALCRTYTAGIPLKRYQSPACRWSLHGMSKSFA